MQEPIPGDDPMIVAKKDPTPCFKETPYSVMPSLGDNRAMETEGSQIGRPPTINDCGSSMCLPNNSTEAEISPCPEVQIAHGRKTLSKQIQVQTQVQQQQQQQQQKPSSSDSFPATHTVAKSATSIPPPSSSTTSVPHHTPLQQQQQQQLMPLQPPPTTTLHPPTVVSASTALAIDSSELTSNRKLSSKKDLRRKNRRRLHRLLMKPGVRPSFLRVIEGRKEIKTEPNTNTITSTVNKTNDVLEVDSDDDFLLEPPMVVIDVDEYLGLKKERKFAEVVLSASRVASNNAIASPTIRSYTKGIHPAPVSSAALAFTANPSDEGWYEGTHPMAMIPDDSVYLTENQEFIRKNMELFTATADDVAMTSNRRLRIARGRVGFRCMHCAKAFQNGEIPRMPPVSVSFPKNFTALYNLAIQKQQMHIEGCPQVPSNMKWSSKKGSSKPRKRMKMGIPAMAYWHISCRRLGIVELQNNSGLRFGRDLELDPLPFESIRMEVEQEQPDLFPRQKQSSVVERTTPTTVLSTNAIGMMRTTTPATTSSTVYSNNLPKSIVEILQQAKREEATNQLIFKDDAAALSDFMFLTIRQATLCHAVKEDFATRGKKTRLMRLGFAGFCCRHCKLNYRTNGTRNILDARVFQNSCRSFSSSRDNIASAMCNSFGLHLMKCAHIPQNIKHAIQSLKRVHPKQMQQLPYGSQSKIFMKIWERVRASDKPIETGVDRGCSQTFIEKEKDEEYIPETNKKTGASNQARSSRFARLRSVPFEGVLANTSRKESTAQGGSVYLNRVEKCAFVHTKNSQAEYWQCLKCRMVPYDYRAPGSIFFSTPMISSLKQHRRICQNDDIYWDTIQSSFDNLNTKYGVVKSLDNRVSFFNMILSIVGSEAKVIDTFMMKLGKKGQPPRSSSDRGIWRRLPLVDFDHVQECFSVLRKDLVLPPASLDNSPEFSKFLQLLSCNFQVPAKKHENGKNEEWSSTSTSTKMIVLDQQKGANLVLPSGSKKINIVTNKEIVTPDCLKNSLHTKERIALHIPSEKSVATRVLSRQISESNPQKGIPKNKDLHPKPKADQVEILLSKPNLTRDQGESVMDNIELGQFDDA